MTTSDEEQLILKRFLGYYMSTIPGTIVCAMVLIAYAVVADFPNSRMFLDRVSFRLVVYSLLANVFYGVAFATSPIEPGWGCGLNALLVHTTLFFSTFLTACIAMNLHLVLVHNFDGANLEKYYLAGSSILSLTLAVIPFSFEQLGWDESSLTCRYNNPNETLRIGWTIGTHSFWVALAAAIEAISSVAVIVWLLQTRDSISGLGNSVSMRGSYSDPNAIFLDVNTGTLRNRPSDILKQRSEYRKLILRIVLYPVVSLLLNVTNVILDLEISVVGGGTSVDFRVVLLNLILYGLRTLFYGLIAVGDPAFMNAVKQLKFPMPTMKLFMSPLQTFGRVAPNPDSIRIQALERQL